MGLLEQLREFVALFGEEVLVLKGAHLASQVYEHVALRPMNDLDVLVRPEAVARAARLLRTLGYRPSPNAALGSYHQSFLRDGDEAPFELHWGVHSEESAFSVEPELLFAAAVKTEFFGHSALVLRPNELLLFLAFHMVKHRFSLHLLALWDLAICVERLGEPEWESLMKTAQEWRFSEGFRVVLGCLSRLGLKTPFGELPEVEQAMARLRAGGEPASSAGMLELAQLNPMVAITRIFSTDLKAYPSRLASAARRVAPLFKGDERKSLCAALCFEQTLEPGLKTGSLAVKFEAGCLLVLMALLTRFWNLRPRARTCEKQPSARELSRLMWAITNAGLTLPVTVTPIAWCATLWAMLRWRGYGPRLMATAQPYVRLGGIRLEPWLELI